METENTLYGVGKMDLRAFTLWLSENNIFRFHMKEFVEFNIEDAKQLIESMEVLGKGKKYPMLTTIGSFVSSDTEVKKFMSQKKNNKYVSANAILTNNIGYKIGTNLFIKFYKPEIPAKLFLKESDAINWLKKFL